MGRTLPRPFEVTLWIAGIFVAAGLGCGAPTAPTVAHPAALGGPRTPLASFQIDRSGHSGEPQPRPTPAPGSRPDASGPLTVAVVSDMNGSYGSTRYGRAVHGAVDWLTDELRPQLVVSTGDHVAGQKTGLDYAAMWSGFHRAVTDPLRKAGIPFAPTPGNHDASAGHRYRRERRRFVREWRTRRPQLQFVDDRHFPLRYAFRKGPALFVSLDATLPGELPDRQFAWLRDVLEANASAPRKIVYGHLPVAPFAEGRESEILGSQRLVELLNQQGVDMVLSGHHHAWYPGVHDGIRMVSMACLGGGPRALIGEASVSDRSVTVLEIPPEGRIRVRARRAPSFDGTIPRTSLPRRLEHRGWTVVRDDVARMSD